MSNIKRQNGLDENDLAQLTMFIDRVNDVFPFLYDTAVNCDNKAYYVLKLNSETHKLKMNQENFHKIFKICAENNKLIKPQHYNKLILKFFPKMYQQDLLSLEKIYRKKLWEENVDQIPLQKREKTIKFVGKDIYDFEQNFWKGFETELLTNF